MRLSEDNIGMTQEKRVNDLLNNVSVDDFEKIKNDELELFKISGSVKESETIYSVDATDRYRHNEKNNDQLSVNLNTSKFNDQSTDSN